MNILLAPAEVDRLVEKYELDYVLLWNDIIKLTDKLVQVVTNVQPRGEEIWHHLLMSIGNFKRQTPISTFSLGVKERLNHSDW